MSGRGGLDGAPLSGESTSNDQNVSGSDLHVVLFLNQEGERRIDPASEHHEGQRAQPQEPVEQD